MRDVRVKRGADVASDHHLVIAKLKLKLKRNRSGQDKRKARFNVNFLKDRTVKENYQIELSNGYQVLQELTEEDMEMEIEIESEWNQIKESLTTTCENTLGRRKTQQKEWISAESYRKIEERKAKKATINTSKTRARKSRAQKAYIAASKEVKKSVRKGKRNYIEGLAKEAEEAASSGNMKQLYDTTKRLCGKFR